IVPGLLGRIARASSARMVDARSPYAAGRAKAAGKSGGTTPGTRKDNTTNRKLCKMRNGFSDWASGVLRNAGQMVRAAMVPQAMKLRSTLTTNMSSGRITVPPLAADARGGAYAAPGNCHSEIT